MSNKLSPPGQSILPISLQYPTSSGPVEAHTILHLHRGGTLVHLAHGGPYNLLLGWSLLASHAELLAIETRTLLTAWAKQEHRIVPLDGGRAQALLIEESETMQKVQALQVIIRRGMEEIQSLLKAQGDALQKAHEAAGLPKNGFGHPITDLDVTEKLN